MTEQMTATGVLVLCGGLCAFWCAIALTIRAHRKRRDQCGVEAQR